MSVTKSAGHHILQPEHMLPWEDTNLIQSSLQDWQYVAQQVARDEKLPHQASLQ